MEKSQSNLRFIYGMLSLSMNLLWIAEGSASKFILYICITDFLQKRKLSKKMF